MTKVSVIDLPLPLPGYYNFFSSWLVVVDKLNILVDPGPTASIDNLIVNLKARGVEKLDAVILTHIHLDHAGGVGDLVSKFNVDKVFCIEKAIKHLVDPTKLWDGTIKTLGDLAFVQGEPKALEKDKVFPASNLIKIGKLEIPVFETPGHASHHISFLINEFLFVGEALGVIVPHDKDYLRPATPVRFIKEVYVDSIKKLKPVHCKHLCFGHYGMKERDEALFEIAENQIKLWVNVLSEAKEGLAECIDKLAKKDQYFSRIDNLPCAIRERERQFVGNSINGVLGYLNS